MIPLITLDENFIEPVPGLLNIWQIHINTHSQSRFAKKVFNFRMLMGAEINEVLLALPFLIKTT